MAKFIFVMFVSAMGADECSDRDCIARNELASSGNSLLATRVNVKRNDEITSDDIWGEIQVLSQDAAGLTRTAANLEQLAFRVSAGTEKLTDAQKALLSSLKSEMQKIIDGLSVDHTEDVGEIAAANAKISACNAKTDGIAEGASNSGSAGTAHDTCRESEATKFTTKKTACELYTTTASAPGAPECMYNFPKATKESDFPAMEKCVEKIFNWAKDWFYSLGSKKEACITTGKDHEDQKKECDASQHAFEQAFCSYRQTLVTKCDEYEACRATAIADEAKVHEGVKVDEAARKATFVAAKNVVCYLGVFEAAAKDQPAELKKCKEATYTTSQLDITYPSVPAGVICDKSPVTSYPCEKAWTDAHYSSKPYFAKAKTEACTPCAPLPPPPTASGGGAEGPCFSGDGYTYITSFADDRDVVDIDVDTFDFAAAHTTGNYKFIGNAAVDALGLDDHAKWKVELCSGEYYDGKCGVKECREFLPKYTNGQWYLSGAFGHSMTTFVKCFSGQANLCAKTRDEVGWVNHHPNGRIKHFTSQNTGSEIYFGKARSGPGSQYIFHMSGGCEFWPKKGRTSEFGAYECVRNRKCPQGYIFHKGQPHEFADKNVFQIRAIEK